ncbi:MAG: N-acetylneuraminate synthase family protein, partial [Thermoanaerobaculales bacterium]|nr:N-acetylneuraminate synthase family protein [Thermoanaerobaculales bacterium]
HLKARAASFVVLHCVSAYPAPFESLNLRFMDELRDFQVPVGYSGHERGISVPVVAVAMGASIIEKHITLDRTLAGPDHAASIEPHGFKKMVRDIRIAEMAMGLPEKHLCQIELLNRHVLRKSLVAASDLEMGHGVRMDDIKVRGPGKGISPQRIDDLIGVVLSRPIKEDDYFVEGDLSSHAPKIIDRRAFRHQWGLNARFHDLEEVLKLHPPMVELHFTDEDVDYPFVAPAVPRPERMVIHAPEFFDKRLLDLAAESDEQRQRSVELLQRTIDKAASMAPSFLGPMAVVIHVGGMSMDRPVENTEILLRRAVESFRQLDPKGVVLLPENLPPRPWYLGGQWYQNLFTRPEEMVDFCRELDLGMTLDLSHAQLYCTLAGMSLSDYVQRCLPLSRHLHVADASGIDGEGLQIGEGVIEWDVILQLLENAEFSWVPEIWSGHLNSFSGFLEAFDRLAKMGGI